MRRFIIALSASVFVSIQMSSATVEEPSVEVQPIVKWDMKQLFDRGGHVGASSFLDVNDDGQEEFICNIGSSADFAAIETDGTVVWRNTVNKRKTKMAYYPQMVSEVGLFLFGHRRANTVYAIHVRTGELAWKREIKGGLEAMEQSAAGLLVGGPKQVTLLDYDSGEPRDGWPVSFNQHEQSLGAGDLDGDGKPEFVLCDTRGHIQVREHDGTLRFKRSSNHGHVDLFYIGNIDQTHSGRELLAVIDDDGSGGSEGDELVLLDKNGKRIRHLELPHGGPNLAIGNVTDKNPGPEVVYGLEGNGRVGMLTGQLEPMMQTSVRNDGGGAGQLALADIDGDGLLEILANSGESPNSGISVVSARGETLDFIKGKGWDFDPMTRKRNAAWHSKVFPHDLNGNGRGEFYASRLGANRQNGHEIIYLLEANAP